VSAKEEAGAHYLPINKVSLFSYCYYYDSPPPSSSSSSSFLYYYYHHHYMITSSFAVGVGGEEGIRLTNG